MHQPELRSNQSMCHPVLSLYHPKWCLIKLKHCSNEPIHVPSDLAHYVAWDWANKVDDLMSVLINAPPDPTIKKWMSMILSKHKAKKAQDGVPIFSCPGFHQQNWNTAKALAKSNCLVPCLNTHDQPMNSICCITASRPDFLRSYSHKGCTICYYHHQVHSKGCSVA